MNWLWYSDSLFKKNSGACIIMQVKMKPELALTQFAVFNHWAVTLINYQATSYLFSFGNYLGPNIQTGSE